MSMNAITTKGIEIGTRVTVTKNLKGGEVIGRILSKEKILYIVRIHENVTNKIVGDFVYTERQLATR